MLTIARHSILLTIILLLGCSQEEKAFRGFAPDEAYLEGSEYPYCGSENAWDLRFFTEHIETLVKRRGQRQMLDLVRGKPEDTVQYAEELLAGNPADQESLFNLAVARAQLGELGRAMEAVRRAEEVGLLFERFLAGPRNPLEPLMNHEPFRQEAARKDIRLIHGPMVGSVTGTSTRFWVRTAEESDLQVIAGSGDTFSPQVRSAIARSSAEADYTAIVELEGLDPGTTYRYEVTVDGRSALDPDCPAFHTAPARGVPRQFEVGFGGGAGYVPGHERMWDVIRSRDPLAFLFLGDHVYIDLPEEPNGVHYYTYYRR